jgi:hypothetical protein
MTTLLLDALVNLDVVRHDASGRYALVYDELSPMVALGRRWSRLVDVVRSGKPMTRADNSDGASEFYPDVTPLLAVFFAPVGLRRAWVGSALRGERGHSMNCRLSRRRYLTKRPRPRWALLAWTRHGRRYQLSR